MDELDKLYHQGSRALQDRYDTRRLADRLGERLVVDTIDDTDREFIERMDMFFLATADEHGKPQCSYKGGDPVTRRSACCSSISSGVGGPG
jgi:predicted pyridoxine 5'-phosphate oxidase superfamily flavin-nucleotide-binding protein